MITHGAVSYEDRRADAYHMRRYYRVQFTIDKVITEFGAGSWRDGEAKGVGCREVK